MCAGRPPAPSRLSTRRHPAAQDATEEREFNLVDNKVVRKPQGFRPNNQRRPGGPRRDGTGPGVGGAGTRGYDDRDALAGGRGKSTRDDRGAGGGGINKRLARLHQRHQQNARSGGGGAGAVRRETSVKIEADWIPLETFNLHELGKLASAVPVATDLKWAGSLEAYGAWGGGCLLLLLLCLLPHRRRRLSQTRTTTS